MAFMEKGSRPKDLPFCPPFQPPVFKANTPIDLSLLLNTPPSQVTDPKKLTMNPIQKPPLHPLPFLQRVNPNTSPPISSTPTNSDSQESSTIRKLSLTVDQEKSKHLKLFSLVGKVFSKEIQSPSHVERILRRAWIMWPDFCMQRIEDNIFLFEFKTEKDADEVFDKRPWNVNFHHLSLQKWKQSMRINDVKFSVSALWIHVFNLPFDMYSVENIKQIGSIFPKLLEYYTDKNGKIALRNYVRMRVEVNLKAPIEVGFVIDNGEHIGTKVYFSYEKLCDFCNICGDFEHSSRVCAKPKPKYGNLMFPESLRAEPPRRSTTERSWKCSDNFLSRVRMDNDKPIFKQPDNVSMNPEMSYVNSMLRPHEEQHIKEALEKTSFDITKPHFAEDQQLTDNTETLNNNTCVESSTGLNRESSSLSQLQDNQNFDSNNVFNNISCLGFVHNSIELNPINTSKMNDFNMIDPALLNSSSRDVFISGNELAAATKNIKLLYPQVVAQGKLFCNKRCLPGDNVEDEANQASKRPKSGTISFDYVNQVSDLSYVFSPALDQRAPAFTLGKTENEGPKVNKKAFIRAIRKLIPKDGIRKIAGPGKKGSSSGRKSMTAAEGHPKASNGAPNDEGSIYRPIMPKPIANSSSKGPDPVRAKPGKN